jgi:uncharacterized protein
LIVARGLPPRGEVTRWWPAVAVVAWIVITLLEPADLTIYREMDPVLLGAAITVTFLTAGVLEEFFFRITLQTRIEAMTGRWPAIVATSLLFAAMHLPSHFGASGGPWWVELAAILSFQGLFGVFLGYLWSRYRAVWPLITVHTAANAGPFVLMLLPAGG